MPFTLEEFLQVFEKYNSSIWPAQVIMYALSIIALLMIIKKVKASDKFTTGILALSWLIAGIGYHIGFFSKINPIANVFGALFVIQGIMLVINGILKNRLHFEYRSRINMWTGWLLIIYAMLIYPLLGSAFGHSYPKVPVFGVAPCPITIFTFGLFLWTARSLPRYLLIIPGLWSLMGFFAALKLGIYQDYGLLISGLIAIPIIMTSNHKKHSVNS